MNIKNAICTAIGATGTVIASFFGGWDYTLQALIFLLICDYGTGIVAAYIQATLSSKIGFKGILKKVLYLIIVAVAVVVDNLTSAGGWIRNVTIYFFIANEGISILENAGKCGLKYPKLLIEKLQQIQDKYTTGGGNNE